MESRSTFATSSPKWMRLLGRAVRSARKRRGMTQADLGDPLLTKGFISQVENGVSAASIESLFFIADRLGTRPAYLLTAADPVILAGATLDMAEAALMMEGPEAAAAWLAGLPELVDEPNTPAPLLVKRIAADVPRLSRRFLRYKAVIALKRGDDEEAVRLLEKASAGTSLVDDPALAFWLGEAYCKVRRRRDAMLTWERLLESNPGPLITVATRLRLAALYEAIGDPVEANRLRSSTPATDVGPGGDNSPAPGRDVVKYLWSLAAWSWGVGAHAAASAYARPVPPLVAARPPANKFETPT